MTGAGEQTGQVRPMLATLSDRRDFAGGWIFERKLDGVRALARVERGRARLFSRSGKPLDATYPEIVDALALQPRDLVLDGEVVALDSRGRTSFSRLQGRMQLRDPEEARASGIAVSFYVFDLLRLDGEDLERAPLRERKRLLRDALEVRRPLRLTSYRNSGGQDLLDDACRRGWEGLVAKRAASRYARRRSQDWLKLKCSAGQELVIGGFTEPGGSRVGFGALLVGYHAGGRLRYAGKVGTGFDERTLRRLRRELDARPRSDCPFDGGAGAVREAGAHWARPDLVAQIGFTEWTRDGKLRHPRFLGLRDDKAAAEVVREQPPG